MRVWLGRMLFVFGIAASVGIGLGSVSQVHSDGPAGFGNSSSLQMQSVVLPSGAQQLVILDPAGKSLAVYHVDAAQARIQLKSVRQLEYDFRMEEYNAQSPLPSELRQVSP